MKYKLVTVIFLSFSFLASQEASAPPVYQEKQQESLVTAWKRKSLAARAAREFELQKLQQLQPQQVTNVNIFTLNCSGDDATSCCNGDGCCAPALKLLSNDGFVGTYVPVILERVRHLLGIGSEDLSDKEQ